MKSRSQSRASSIDSMGRCLPASMRGIAKSFAAMRYRAPAYITSNHRCSRQRRGFRQLPRHRRQMDMLSSFVCRLRVLASGRLDAIQSRTSSWMEPPSSDAEPLRAQQPAPGTRAARSPRGSRRTRPRRTPSATGWANPQSFAFRVSDSVVPNGCRFHLLVPHGPLQQRHGWSTSQSMDPPGQRGDRRDAGRAVADLEWRSSREAPRGGDGPEVDHRVGGRLESLLGWGTWDRPTRSGMGHDHDGRHTVQCGRSCRWRVARHGRRLNPGAARRRRSRADAR